MIVIWQAQPQPDGSGGRVYVVEMPLDATRQTMAPVLAGSEEGYPVAWVQGIVVPDAECGRYHFTGWCDRYLQGRSRKTQEARRLAFTFGWRPERLRKGDHE